MKAHLIDPQHHRATDMARYVMDSERRSPFIALNEPALVDGLDL